MTTDEETRQRVLQMIKDEAFRCSDCDCNVINEHYAVKNDVWALSGLGPLGGRLCILCLEKRIGRMLTTGDFDDFPINRTYMDQKSGRLLNRLGFV